MKIIISRKGFDSSSGKIPSPILPDGRMISLPIPDKTSKIQYQDISWDEHNIGNITEQLTNGKIPCSYNAHLDPDIISTSLTRHTHWKPIFGQEGPSQKHLENHNISEGDLFLFFGLFKEVIFKDGVIKFNKLASPKHVFWGWLQISEIISKNNFDLPKYNWCSYHPHYYRFNSKKHNSIYISKNKLEINGKIINNLDGAGIFKFYNQKLQLTVPNSKLTSIWKLPVCFYPKNKDKSLSYHDNIERWEKKDDHVLLSSVGRGQEFVLDATFYPDVINWVLDLFQFKTQ